MWIANTVEGVYTKDKSAILGTVTAAKQGLNIITVNLNIGVRGNITIDNNIGIIDVGLHVPFHAHLKLK